MPAPGTHQRASDPPRSVSIVRRHLSRVRGKTKLRPITSYGTTSSGPLPALLLPAAMHGNDVHRSGWKPFGPTSGRGVLPSRACMCLCRERGHRSLLDVTRPWAVDESIHVDSLDPIPLICIPSPPNRSIPRHQLQLGRGRAAQGFHDLT